MCVRTCILVNICCRAVRLHVEHSCTWLYYMVATRNGTTRTLRSYNVCAVGLLLRTYLDIVSLLFLLLPNGIVW